MDYSLKRKKNQDIVRSREMVPRVQTENMSGRQAAQPACCFLSSVDLGGPSVLTSEDHRAA